MNVHPISSTRVFLGSFCVGGFYVVFMIQRPENSTKIRVSRDCFDDALADCSRASVLGKWSLLIGANQVFAMPRILYNRRNQ